MELETSRLKLRHWRETDGDNFAALHANPIVNADLGGPFRREKSDKKLARYIKAQTCLLYTSPSPRDATLSRMPSSA